MPDETTTSRVLRVLSLLQSRRYWSGPELASRVGVSARTIRRDVDRLRELGYRVTTERGVAGGYLLEAGSALPPLLFTGEEAVALAVSLRTAAASGAVRGIADLSTAVLAKLEQVLPPAVRARVSALQAAMPPLTPVDGADPVDPEVLAVLALACRDSEIVRFGYSAADGSATRRRVEPVALVPVRRRWYLLAWDIARDDWRTFRLDRVTDPEHSYLHVSRRGVPGSDAEAFVTQRLGGAAEPRFAATVRIDAPRAVVEDYLGGHTTGLASDGDEHTLWRIRDDRVELLASALTWLIWPFTIVDGDELEAFMGEFLLRLGPRSD